MTDINLIVDDIEDLGRAVFDGRKARDASRGKIHPRIFKERNGVKSLSVDRLTIACIPQLVATHDSERADQNFHGWAVVSYPAATQMSRVVYGLQTDSNPWHAEIQLCASEAELLEEEQTEHALNLANNASWRAKS